MKVEPVNPMLPVLWHGGDYNPDQWPDDVRVEDVRLMKLAGVNVASTAIFAWSQLERSGGRFDWSWLDATFDRFETNGLYVNLATPSASPPRWMVREHPEYLRVNSHGKRLPFGGRVMFCPTSPGYRAEVARINSLLAERYGGRKALVMWHISNEYGGGACFCGHCIRGFREWLKRRYGTLDAMNHEYWSTFWSHRFETWDDVTPPWAAGGTVPNGFALDWRRFTSHQVLEFLKAEIATLKAIAPDVPVTTNLMGFYDGLDYAQFADVLDVVSWDSYPSVGGDPTLVSFAHAYMRGIKRGRPWLLMEQTPSATNWQEYPRLKPPGLMRLWSWAAMAHGSDSSMYFQWRRTRGAHEKYHGAVVAHDGTERPRVFREVAELGGEMAKASSSIVGTLAAPAKVGLLWDTENRWGFDGSCGPVRHKDQVGVAHRLYRAALGRNVPVDVVRLDADWSRYDVLVAPQLYMVKSGRYPLDGSPEELRARVDVAAKLRSWVSAGGTLVATYFTGYANESDLVYEGGYPGPLRDLLGIWVEETDVPEPGKTPNTVMVKEGAFAGAKASYGCDRVFDMVNLEGAEALAAYGSNWYAGRPCLTVNRFGEGRAYYLGTDPEDALLVDLLSAVLAEKGIEPMIPPVPGVEVLAREGSGRRLLFVLNHNDTETEVDLGAVSGTDVLTDEKRSGRATMPAYGVWILEAD